MDQLLRLFDLFNETAKKAAGYLPQSADDLILLFKQLLSVVSGLNSWIATNIGVNLQSILAAIGRIVVLWFTFLFDLLRNIVERI